MVGIGGSAINDGWQGFAVALGYRFLDANSHPLESWPDQLARLEAIERPENQGFPETVVAPDVTNPLLGEHGATAVYGPQKGVAPEMQPA